MKWQGRTLYKDGFWNTLYLPFDVDQNPGGIFADAEVRRLDTDGKYNADGEKYDVEDTSLNEADFTYQTGQLDADGTMHIFFQECTASANIPYIVRWSGGGSDIVNPVFTNVQIIYCDEPHEITSCEGDHLFDGNLTFVGTGYAPVDIYTADKTNLYLGADNKLYYPWGEGMTEFDVGPFRAYFRLNNGLTCGEPDSGVRAFNINNGGEQTGIAEQTILNSQISIQNGIASTVASYRASRRRREYISTQGAGS